MPRTTHRTLVRLSSLCVLGLQTSTPGSYTGSDMMGRKHGVSGPRSLLARPVSGTGTDERLVLTAVIGTVNTKPSVITE